MILNKIDHLVYVSPVVPDLLFNKFNICLKDKSTLVMYGFVLPEYACYQTRPIDYFNIRISFYLICIVLIA